MHTARNTFIATLAIADLILCLFTVPVTLADILTKYWPFGSETYLLCKVKSCNVVILFQKETAKYKKRICIDFMILSYQAQFDVKRHLSDF